MMNQRKNILYLSGINNTKKYGYFNAVYSRVKYLKENNVEHNIIFASIPFVDSTCVRVIKSMFGLQINEEPLKEESFIDFIPIKQSIFGYILKLFNSSYFENKLYKIVHDLCIKNSIDFIHIHWVYPYGYIASKIYKDLNIPYVLNAHGSDINVHPFRSKDFMAKTVEALNSAQKVYYVSDSLYSNAKKLEGMQNLNYDVTYNGVDLVDKLEIDKVKKFHICFIGLLTNTKGADRLIPIFKKLALKIPNIKLSIIGDGPYYNEINRHIKEDNLNIELFGYLTSKEIIELRSRFDLSIITSRSEGFPLVPLESYSYGISVVATKCIGLIDLVVDKNLLIEDNDRYIENFSDAVVHYYIDDYDNYRKKQDKYVNYAKKYSWNKIVKIESEKYLK